MENQQKEKEDERKLDSKLRTYFKKKKILNGREKEISRLRKRADNLKDITTEEENFLRRNLPYVSDPNTEIPKAKLYTFYSFNENLIEAFPQVYQFLNNIQKLEGEKFLIYSVGGGNTEKRNDGFLLARLTPGGYQFEGKSGLYPSVENLYEFQPYKGFYKKDFKNEAGFPDQRLELTNFLEEIVKNGWSKRFEKGKPFLSFLPVKIAKEENPEESNEEYKEIPGFQVRSYDDKPKQGNLGGVISKEHMIPASGLLEKYLVIGDKRVNEILNQYQDSLKNKKSRYSFKVPEV